MDTSAEACLWAGRREKADVYWNFLMTAAVLSASLAHFEHSFRAREKTWKILLEMFLVLMIPAYVFAQLALSILFTLYFGRN